MRFRKLIEPLFELCVDVFSSESIWRFRDSQSQALKALKQFLFLCHSLKSKRKIYMYEEEMNLSVCIFNEFIKLAAYISQFRNIIKIVLNLSLNSYFYVTLLFSINSRD